MGIYIEIEKPRCCGYCHFAVPTRYEGEEVCRCKITPVPSYKAISYPGLLPRWCPIVELPKEEYEIGRKCVEEIKKELDEAAIYGKSKRQQAQEWNTQRFYNMDSALTRIEELARQMQEEAKKIGDIVNEGFTVKRYGGYGDESRTEDA